VEASAQAGCTIPENWNPVPDLPAAAVLGRALRALPYTEESVEHVLGDDGPSAGLTDVAVFERRLDDSPLATAIRLLLLELTVTRADALDAFYEDGVEALLGLGLARSDGDRIVPRGRIVPAEGLLFAFDGFARGDDDPVGYVASYTPTASWLAALTPRRQARRALDIGTGSGAQALLASRHADHVIDTDVNQRAIDLTAINAALNGIENVEVRLGSLFEPVAGETFDLITCNAPYVVSPEDRWHYRDAAGFEADQLSHTLVREVPAYLEDDGHASMLVSWLAESEDDPDARVEQWLENNGCDAWVIGLSGSDPLDHAAGWNEHLADDPEDYGVALDRWTAYFDDLGMGWITEGAVLLHKRAGDVHVIRTDSAEEDDLEYASDQIGRVFGALELVARVDDPSELLGERVTLAQEARIEQAVGEEGARVVLEGGTWPELQVDDETADVLVELDGQVTLADAFDRARVPRRRSTLEDLQELLELGILGLVAEDD
jgi:SAM-dependent methyltransferase